MKPWEMLEQYICGELKVIDPSIKRSPGSGNGFKKGDVCCKTNIGLHLEAKQRNKLNVWESKWLTKCESEIPLHSKKMAIVVTENNKKEKHVHLSADDFFNMYIEYWRLKNEG